MFTLADAARFAGIPFESLRWLLKQGLVECSEHLGSGRGNGRRFSARDLESLEVYKMLRSKGWPARAAGAGSRAFRRSLVPMSEARIIVFPDDLRNCRVIESSESLPRGVESQPTVMIAHLRRITRRAAA